MLLKQLAHPCFQLTAIISLEYFGIDERTDLVNVGNHFGYVFALFRSHRSGDFVSGSNVNSRKNVLVLIPYNASVDMYNNSN